MPNIAEIKKIILSTPITQPLLFVSVHGMGKSEVCKQVFNEMGYEFITFFCGQAGDQGDIIGLPCREEVDFTYGGKTVKRIITNFGVPVWWPRNDSAKIAFMFDEFNRGKPEIYNCIMDMVLNRKLNGQSLPRATRIIAAMNPIDEELGYDVQELDPALIDRFNIYKFEPSSDEWIDYATKTQHNKYVIGFISKNTSYLDPPKTQIKSGEVYPSRRSWTRVSDIMNKNPCIEKSDEVFFKTLLIGIVGLGATSKFVMYIREAARNISGAKVVTFWNHEVEVEVRGLEPQEITHLNKEIAIYLSENEKVLFDAISPQETHKYVDNVTKYLQTIPHELAAEFFDHVSRGHQESKTWPKKLLDNSNILTTWFIDVLHGKSEHDKKVEQIIEESQPDVDEIING